MIRLIRKFLFFVMALPIPGYWRARCAFWAGVKFNSKEKKRDVFLGQNVQIDSMHPEDISIGNWTTIATGSVILSHFLSPEDEKYPFFSHRRGKINIGTGVFIGANSVICKPVSIGDGSIIGACSVVLTDIPSHEIWAGNPAKFLKKRL